MTKYISRHEAALRLRCNDQTVTNWVAKGILKGRKMGRALMIDADTLESYADTLQDIAHTESQLKEWKNQLENKWRLVSKQMHDLRKDLRLNKLVMGYAKDIIRSIAEIVMASEEFRERESAIFARYVEGETMEDIAEDYGLNRERVRQIIAIVIRKFGQIRNYQSIAEENRTLLAKNKELSVAYSIALEELEELRAFKGKIQPYIDKGGVTNASRWAEDSEKERIASLLVKKANEFDVSVRALHCIEAAGIVTIGDLAACRKQDILNLRNTGSKTVYELEELLEKLGLAWGMNVKSFLGFYKSIK